MGKLLSEAGVKILLSRRLDAYLMDTLAICIASPFAFILCRYGKSATSNMGYIEIYGLISWAILLLFGRLFAKGCVFYHDQGLLLSKPFRPHRSIPWSEIGSIQERPSAPQNYNILD